MTLDHVWYYLAELLPIPFWFGIIGRIAAPLFFFCTVKGVFYTHNRFRYCRRLYLAAVIMACGNLIMNRFFGHPLGTEVTNSIFSTLFFVVFFLSVIEYLRDQQKPREIKTSLICIFLLLLPFLIGIIESILPPSHLQTFLKIILLSPFDVEGGFIWVLFGVGLYYSMARRSSLVIFYLAFSLLFFASESSFGLTMQNLLVENHQWLMILALPLMLLYNEQRGKSRKWFFYFYYPFHIYLLVFLARWIAGTP